MKKQIFTYILLLNFSFLFISVLWGSHLHHNNSYSISTCSNYVEIINSESKKSCFKYGISELIIEHLFEKGAVNENTVIKFFYKLNNVFPTFLLLPVKNYKISNLRNNIFLKTVTIIPEKILLFKIISPRSPPFYS